MRRAILLSLLLAACDGGPTLAGGDATPEDGRLFFTRAIPSSDDTFWRELRMVDDLDGTSVPVSAGAEPRRARPAVSRDGRYLAWTTANSPWLTPDGDYGLVTLDRHTGALRQLLPTGVAAGSPSWTDDGWLVYLRTDVTGVATTRLVRSRADGSGFEQLLPDDAPLGTDPGVSPDGRRIAWIRGVPWPQVEVVVLADGAATVLTTESADDGDYALRDVTWSPDGGHVAFVQLDYPNEAASLRVLDLHGVEVAERALPGGASRPAWSPDGARIAYCVQVRESVSGPYRSRVRIFRFGAEEETTLTPPDADDCDPTWSR